MQDEYLRDRKPREFLRRLYVLADSVAENAPIIKRIFFPVYALKNKQF